MFNLKSITEIRNEKPYYFVCIHGSNLFESESFTECKDFLANYLKEHKKEILKEKEFYEYYIGMYSIAIY